MITTTTTTHHSLTRVRACVRAPFVNNRYTLRYTGGMVPDVYHILVKNKGVFSNVASTAAKAKLRLLYECAPIALLVEAAGGARCGGEILFSRSCVPFVPAVNACA